ncbi:MAG: DUF695 domain-containing protein [Pseudomonadota bacterium]
MEYGLGLLIASINLLRWQRTPENESTNMSDERWDFYSCNIDGKPHSTMVNLSLFSDAPIDKLSMFHCIAVNLKFPHPEHGMTTDDEYQVLYEMEDFIFENQNTELKYIARQTGDNKRKFYFYASPQADFNSLVESLGSAYPSYEKSTFSFEDSRWTTYFDDLYPNAMAWNEISNRAVCFRLEEGGDDLNIPRTIDHSIIFHDKKKMKEFEKTVLEKGFTVEIKKTGFFKKEYDLLVQRENAPAELDPITFELQDLAERLGGSYDGWGCYQATSKE